MATRKEIKQKLKKKKKQQELAPFLIIGGLVIVVLAIVILSQIKPKVKFTVPEITKAAQTDGLTMGDPNAKVKVVEFADFQCPFCGTYWSQLEPTIITQYVDTGKVHFTYHPFSFLGRGNAWDESVKSAEAAYCANDQDMFWEYHGMIYANQNGENQGAFSETNLVAFAEALELDIAAFKSCLKNGTYTAQVQTDNENASALGASYTPSFLINGQIVGYNELIATIDAALTE
jgi:protein-disulfide isomerase